MKAIILTSLLGIATLFAGVFNMKNRSVYLVIAGLIATLFLLVSEWNEPKAWFSDMVMIDHYSIAFSFVITSVLILLCGLGIYHYRDGGNSIADLYGLMVFSLVGGMLLASYNNLVMLFLGIEILSIPLYILAGSNRVDKLSNESALKYFLTGSFASGILLFGIALVFGATGSFNLEEIAGKASTMSSPLLFIGVLLIFSGFLFKIAAVPFHFWAPDVYTGAPGLVTAFMATIVKTAGFAAFYRLFSTAFVSEEGAWFRVLWIITALTLLSGNIMALYQTRLKRLLAYSSIAHAGYLLLAILTLNKQSANAILYYTAAYSVSSVVAFGVLIAIIESLGNDDLNSLKGLGKQNPLLAFVFTLALLSMAGIPPLAGFFGKYYLFSLALKSNLFYIVMVAIVASIIGAWYYIKTLSLMYMTPADGPSTSKIELGSSYTLVLLVASALSLFLGLFPGSLAGLLG